jgi:hypothetical protein
MTNPNIADKILRYYYIQKRGEKMTDKRLFCPKCNEKCDNIIKKYRQQVSELKHWEHGEYQTVDDNYDWYNYDLICGLCRTIIKKYRRKI